MTSLRTLHASALQNRAGGGTTVPAEATSSSSSALKALVAGPARSMLSSESFDCTNDKKMLDLSGHCDSDR